MGNTYNRLRLLFLGALILACAAVWAHQVFDIWPKQRCEAMGHWWDAQDRQCGIPMPIWRFTGRRAGAAASVKPTATSSATMDKADGTKS